MAQSGLEMAMEVVIAHLETYHLSLDQVVQMLERTHANLMVQRQEETAGRAPATALGERTQPLAAREITARRRQLVRETRPWEKAPRYMQAHSGKLPR